MPHTLNLPIMLHINVIKGLCLDRDQSLKEGEVIVTQVHAENFMHRNKTVYSQTNGKRRLQKKNGIKTRTTTKVALWVGVDWLCIIKG